MKKGCSWHLLLCLWRYCLQVVVTVSRQSAIQKAVLLPRWKILLLERNHLPIQKHQNRNRGETQSQQIEEGNSEMQMDVRVGGSTFTATLEENEAVDALVEMMEQAPVTIQMRDYSGFEKVGPLGTSLPTSNRQITTQTGDIVLYQGDQIVMFYGSNSWSYTRLGRIEDLTGWEEALGSGDVTVTFSLED